MKNFRTIMIMAVAIVMSLSLAACGSKAAAPDSSDLQFSGKIDSIDGDEAIVTPDEGEDICSSGDAVRINIADYSKPLNVGDNVTIYYDGVIMESYPLQINLLGINDEMFNIEESSNSADSNESVTFDNPEVLE